MGNEIIRMSHNAVASAQRGLDVKKKVISLFRCLVKLDSLGWFVVRIYLASLCFSYSLGLARETEGSISGHVPRRG